MKEAAILVRISTPDQLSLPGQIDSDKLWQTGSNQSRETLTLIELPEKQVITVGW